MKLVLKVICWISAIFCLVFPCVYFHSDMDKQEVKASHILVNTQEEAAKIRKEIVEDGKSFEEMAEKYSLCPTKADKGNLNFNPRGNLVKDFEKVLFSLKPNVISEPVKTEYGWHIIKVTDIKYFSDKVNFERRYL